MTHKDIYIKFMIEYDKANVTSSYPSLTEYEVATVLDKAYNALIAQKVTGNNVRRAGFEMDTKAMEDLAPLVVQDDITLSAATNVASNVYSGSLKNNHLYFIDAYLKKVTPAKSYAFLAYDTSITNTPSTTEDVVNSEEACIAYYDNSSTPQTDASVFGGDFASSAIWCFHADPIIDANVYDKMKFVCDDPNDISFYVRVYIKNDSTVQSGDYEHYEEYQLTGNISNQAIHSGDNIKLMMQLILNQIQLQYINNNTNNISDFYGADPVIIFEADSNYAGTEDQSSAKIQYINTRAISGGQSSVGTPGDPIDNVTTRNVPVNLVTHQIAKRFFSTIYNLPWVKTPVCYIESSDSTGATGSNDKIFVVVDPWDIPSTSDLRVVYIKTPNTFVKNLSANPVTYESFFDPSENATDEVRAKYVFELNDTVAEELVSLAVTFALENVESPRLNSKLNMRGLEA